MSIGETANRNTSGEAEKERGEHRNGAAGLGRNQLKLLAIVCMTMDHVAYIFLPNLSPLSFLLRFFGRVTAPLMCFFLAEGYFYTRSVKRYGERLLLVALLSQPVFARVCHSQTFFPPYNMLFTLFLSLLCLEGCKRGKDYWVFALLGASCFCDWGLYAPLWVICFAMKRNQPRERNRRFLLVALLMWALDLVSLLQNGLPWYSDLWQLGVVLSLPLIGMYRKKEREGEPIPGRDAGAEVEAEGEAGEMGEEKGLEKRKKSMGELFLQWFFYLYYPLHLFVLLLIREAFHFR